jgi:hypothetical protein
MAPLPRCSGILVAEEREGGEGEDGDALRRGVGRQGEPGPVVLTRKLNPILFQQLDDALGLPAHQGCTNGAWPEQ